MLCASCCPWAWQLLSAPGAHQKLHSCLPPSCSDCSTISTESVCTKYTSQPLTALQSVLHPDLSTIIAKTWVCIVASALGSHICNNPCALALSALPCSSQPCSSQPCSQCSPCALALSCCLPSDRQTHLVLLACDIHRAFFIPGASAQFGPLISSASMCNSTHV